MYWMLENTAAMPHTIRNDITRYSCKKIEGAVSWKIFHTVFMLGT
jgi:hypothetical protein